LTGVGYGREVLEQERSTRAQHGRDGDLAWWALLACQNAGRDFAGAMATLDVLSNRFGAAVVADSLRADNRFRALVESKEFAERAPR